MERIIQSWKYSQFIKLYFLGKQIYPFLAFHLRAVDFSGIIYLNLIIPYFWGSRLTRRLNRAKLNQAKQSGANHWSVAVVLQVQEVAGPEAALLHNASLHHHLHLVFEGVLSHLIIAACCSACLWREKSWRHKQVNSSSLSESFGIYSEPNCPISPIRESTSLLGL